MTFEQFSQLAVILADLCNEFQGSEVYCVSDVILETRVFHSMLTYTVSITQWQTQDLSIAYGCGNIEEEAFQDAISYIKREIAEKAAV